MRRLFVVEDVPAWSPALRSRTTIRTSVKRQLTDPSIAAAMMRVDVNGLLHDLNTFGFLFESLCTRDLRVYAQSNDGEVFHSGGKFAYKRKDGVLVVPLACLKD